MASCILLLGSCGAQINSNPADERGSVDGGALGPWSTPATVTVAATQAIEDDVTLTSNALEMVYAIADPMTGKKDLYYTSRTAIGAPWAQVAPLPFDRTASSEEAPRFSADDRTLYFASDRAADDGNLDIYAVPRTAAGNAAWGLPQPVAPLTTAVIEKWLSPCSGGHYVVVQATTAGDTDLFEGTLGSAAPPTPISALNTTDGETGAFLTADCLTLYFASFHVTPERIFVSHRAAVGSPWQAPMQVDEFQIPGGSGGAQEDPWMSSDGRTFVFASDAGGTKDIYLSTR
jgi:WD40 repeat protein